MPELCEKWAAPNNAAGKLTGRGYWYAVRGSGAPAVFKMNSNQRTERQLSNP